MPLSGTVLLPVHTILKYSGLVPLLRLLSSLADKVANTINPVSLQAGSYTTSHIHAIFQETRDEGLLTPVQTEIIQRMTRLNHLNLKSVMVPANEVDMVNVNSKREQLLEVLERDPYTRYPVYRKSVNHVIGYINIYDCLLDSEFDNKGLDKFLRPLKKLSAGTNVSDALKIMQEKNEKMVLVTRSGHSRKGRPAGIVTMKDLTTKEDIYTDVINQLRQNGFIYNDLQIKQRIRQRYNI